MRSRLTLPAVVALAAVRGHSVGGGEQVISMYRALLKHKPRDRSEEDVRLIVTMLKNIKFLKTLTHQHLIDVCRVIELKPFRARGLSIIRQGEVGAEFFIILRGSVSVYVRNMDAGDTSTGDTDLGWVAQAHLAAPSRRLLT